MISTFATMLANIPKSDLGIRNGTEMANGWVAGGAVQDQIDDTLRDAMSAARARMPTGPSTDECDECGERYRHVARPGAHVWPARRTATAHPPSPSPA